MEVGISAAAPEARDRKAKVMLIRLFEAAAEQSLTINLRINPPASGEYQLQVWVGPRLGERYEWTRRFPIRVPQEDALQAIADDILDYCKQHEGWGRRWGKSSTRAPELEAA